MIAVNAQIATAVRYGNVVYDRLATNEDRDKFAALWIRLEREVTTAETLGDIHRIEAAITDWRRKVATEFREATRG